MEGISLVSGCFGYLVIVLELALAVVAIVKLRLSASGVLFALGFAGLAFKGLLSRLVYSFYFSSAIERMAYEDVQVQMTAFSLLMSVTGIFLWVLIAVGGFLLPGALKPR